MWNHILTWLVDRWCRLTGGHEGVTEGRGGVVRLRCARCGLVSPGWDVRPAVMFSGPAVSRPAAPTPILYGDHKPEGWLVAPDGTQWPVRSVTLEQWPPAESTAFGINPTDPEMQFEQDIVAELSRGRHQKPTSWRGNRKVH